MYQIYWVVQLNDILLIGIISVICSADSWNEMELYAQEKEDFLRTFLDLPNGIPSHDTFNRVFSSIDSTQFEVCFIEWVKSISRLVPKEVIAIGEAMAEKLVKIPIITSYLKASK